MNYPPSQNRLTINRDKILTSRIKDSNIKKISTEDSNAGHSAVLWKKLSRNNTEKLPTLYTRKAKSSQYKKNRVKNEKHHRVPSMKRKTWRSHTSKNMKSHFRKVENGYRNLENKPEKLNPYLTTYVHKYMNSVEIISFLV